MQFQLFIVCKAPCLHRNFLPLFTEKLLRTTMIHPGIFIAEYDTILSQWERANIYNHLSNYTNLGQF